MEKFPTSSTPSVEPVPSESLVLEEALTLEEKRLIADAWATGVAGTPAPANPESFSNEEMGEWLRDSLMEGVAGFADDVGIKPNEEILSALETAVTTAERAELEEKYINDIQQQMNAVKNRVRAERGKRETRWDSCPTTMREHQTWNCVGGTLIATQLLEDTGIKNYSGWVPGHLFNVLQLSNGDWWYADFTNNNCFKVEPTEGELEDIKTINIRDKRTDYELIGLGEDGSVAAILGNLYGMRAEAADPKIKGAGKDSAVVEMNKFAEIFSQAPFGNVRKKLYPEFCNFQESTTFKEEEARVENLKKEQTKHVREFERFTQPITELTQVLTSEEVEELLTIFRVHTQDAEALLLATPEEARAELEQLNLPQKLEEIIQIRINQLADLIKSGEEEMYDALLRHTIRAWHNM